VYGLGWLIVWTLMGAAGGLAIGLALARRQSNQTADQARQLETELATSRRELDTYRHEVVAQFSDTARKFQSLNDAYTDLHQQLAKSSSILCGDIGGPLLQAPQGHQDLIPADLREAAGAQQEPAGAQQEPAGAQEELAEQEEPARAANEAADDPLQPAGTASAEQTDLESEAPVAVRSPAAAPEPATDPLAPQVAATQPQKAAALHEAR
jgi:uncharacterized membrane-anchored protein YhcB (DUF1043 family)